MLNYLVFIAAALIGFLLRQLEIPIPYMLGGILAAFCCKTFYRPTFSGSLSLRNAMLGIAGYGIGAHCTSCAWAQNCPASWGPLSARFLFPSVLPSTWPATPLPIC